LQRLQQALQNAENERDNQMDGQAITGGIVAGGAVITAFGGGAVGAPIVLLGGLWIAGNQPILNGWIRLIDQLKKEIAKIEKQLANLGPLMEYQEREVGRENAKPIGPPQPTGKTNTRAVPVDPKFCPPQPGGRAPPPQQPPGMGMGDIKG
jgi:hypothetical protein